ncbi:MAG: aconitase X catalytic domain-containing protein [Candidatus Bathyarchaeia archaeon]
MYLTKEEEHIYDGELGWANQVCIKILVRLGELFGADRLIPINSAHVSGVSYKTLGDASSEFLEALAESDVKAKVKATTNPHSIDKKHILTKIPKETVEKQSAITKNFEKMGFTNALTCTPYYLERPKRNTHMAWSESSAVVYANSILNAWTNREGGPSALAAAIIGKTPNYGIHRAEERQPKVLVTLNTQLKDETEFGALGTFLGEILEDKIPAIKGLEGASKDNLKQLGAALASTGMVNMFHFYNENMLKKKLEKVSVDRNELAKVSQKLTTVSTKKPDLIFIGCPHCSLTEIKRVANLISNKKIRSDLEFWVCTSQHIKEKAGKYATVIEMRGGRIITDTCAVVTWTDMLGIKTIMTNSAKTAHYAPTLNKADVTLAPLEKCIKTALKE